MCISFSVGHVCLLPQEESSLHSKASHIFMKYSCRSLTECILHVPESRNAPFTSISYLKYIETAYMSFLNHNMSFKEMDIYLVFSTISNEHLIKSCKLYEQKPFLTNEVSCPVQDLRVETVRRRPGMQEVLPSRECTTHFRLPLFILLATCLPERRNT